jgi:heterodisulfide reductase subunit D
VARGKVQLLLAINNGELDPTDTIARYLYRCLDCRLCQQTCPGGVRTDEIFAGARKWMAQTEWLPAPLRDLRQRVEASHNIAGEDNAHRAMWQENLEQPAALTEQADVVFFTGCVSALYPMVYGIPQSFVQLLAQAGVSYATMGGAEWCCGYPLLAAGADADALIAHNIEAVEALRPRWLVATCPSCHKTWKADYPDKSFDVLHSTELLLRLLEEGRIQPAHPPAIRRQAGRDGPIRVTYHDPCDLGRKGGIYDPPRQILSRLPGVEFVEMASNRANALCCGGGGNLESLEGDLSAAIATRRLAQAQRVDAEVIVTACQQCQRTLGMAARRDRVRIPTMDIAQIVLATLGNGEPA